jgi:hypothetical protein
MRNSIPSRSVAARFVLVLTLSSVAPAFGADPTPPSTVPPATLSIFVTNDTAAKDPFFPQRQLFDGNSTGKTPSPRPVRVESLVLKGIIGPPEKRFALINNATFAPGEQLEIRVDVDRKVTVKCVEIRKDTVVVEVVNAGSTERRELKIAR